MARTSTSENGNGTTRKTVALIASLLGMGVTVAGATLYIANRIGATETRLSVVETKIDLLLVRQAAYTP
jgi:hypothetical protein